MASLSAKLWTNFSFPIKELQQKKNNKPTE